MTPSTSSTPGTSESNTAAAPRRSDEDPAKAPADDGNYRVIHRLALDYLATPGLVLTDQGELVEAVKALCARHSIDYGRAVDPDVVHRACASAWFVHRSRKVLA